MCTYRVSNAYHIIASAPGSEAGRVGRQLELIRAWTAASDFAFEANSTLLRAAIRSPAPAPAPAATPTRVWARPGLIVASVEIILTSYAHAQLSNQATNSPSWSAFAKDPLLYTVPLSLSLSLSLFLLCNCRCDFHSFENSSSCGRRADLPAYLAHTSQISIRHYFDYIDYCQLHCNFKSKFIGCSWSKIVQRYGV